MKLRAGQPAPLFTAMDIWGNEIDLRNVKSDKILLSFFRYAECAMCNVQISRIMRARDSFTKNSIQIIAIFESPKQSLKKSIADRHAFNFPIIADVKRELYNLYEVQPSWRKTVQTTTLKGFQHIAEAMKSGYKIGGKVEGTFNQIPADFLINKDGIIETAHYGNSVIDHLPFERIFRSQMLH